MKNNLCQICNKIFKNLGKHLKEHSITAEEYYVSFINTSAGYCKICGNKTKFKNLTNGFQIYCSNKCHGLDTDAQAKHSFKLRNKSTAEKEEIRNKQINAWENNYGENWSTILTNKSFKTYKENTGYNTPFDNPETRLKAEQKWNGASPSLNEEVKFKIAKSVSEYMTETGIEKINEQTFLKFKEKCPNIINYSTDNFLYHCSECNKDYNLRRLFVYRRLLKNYDLCPKCYFKKGTSSQEYEISNYIKTIYNGKIEEHNKSILSGKELDIYLPDLKLAFEFDGTYWHADPRFYNENDIIKNKSAKEIWEKDKIKNQLCAAINIKLIRIKEFDWENNQDEIKKLLNEVINNVKF